MDIVCRLDAKNNTKDMLLEEVCCSPHVMQWVYE